VHFVAVFKIFSQGAARQEIVAGLRAQFTGYSWVRPLGDTYIISINTPDDREEIRARLVAVAKSRKEKNQRMLMLIGPQSRVEAMGGFLPNGMWKKINQRTRENG
jgi:hypothetical protein